MSAAIGREQRLNKDRFGQTWYRVVTANSSESVFNETCQFVRVLPIWQVWLTVAYRQLFRGKGMFVEQRQTIGYVWGVRLLTYEVFPNHNGSLVVGQE